MSHLPLSHLFEYSNPHIKRGCSTLSEMRHPLNKSDNSPQCYTTSITCVEISSSRDKMEQVDFDQSLKNIPFGGKKEYVKQMTHSIRKTDFSMRLPFILVLSKKAMNRRRHMVSTVRRKYHM